MFTAWGRFVYRHRRAVAVASLLIALSAGSFAARISSVLSSGGWVDKGSESYAVQERLADLYGGGKSTFVAMFFGPAGTDARSASFQALVAQGVAPLAADPRVAGIVGFAQRADDRFISNDGTGTYVVAGLTLDDEAAVEALPELRAEIVPVPGLTSQLTGYAPLSADADSQSEKDLQERLGSSHVDDEDIPPEPVAETGAPMPSGA